MDTVVRTYDPKNVKVIIGVVPVTGFVSVTVTQPEDSFEKGRASDGTVDRTARNINDYQVTLMVKGTSLINSVLSEFHATDLLNNQGRFPLIIEDLDRIVPVLVAETAWVVKYPDMELGDTSADREWTIDTGPAQFTPGGTIF